MYADHNEIDRDGQRQKENACHRRQALRIGKAGPAANGNLMQAIKRLQADGGRARRRADRETRLLFLLGCNTAERHRQRDDSQQNTPYVKPSITHIHAPPFIVGY